MKKLKRRPKLSELRLSNLIYFITECKSPKEIWDTLKQRFERDTFTNKVFLKQSLILLIGEHLQKLKVITDQLAAIKALIPEDEHMVTLLLSLPRTYNTRGGYRGDQSDHATKVKIGQKIGKLK